MNKTLKLLVFVALLTVIASSAASAQIILYSQSFTWQGTTPNGDGNNSNYFNQAFGTTSANELTNGWAVFQNGALDTNNTTAANNLGASFSISDRTTPNTPSPGGNFGVAVGTGNIPGTIFASTPTGMSISTTTPSLTFSWAQGDSVATDTAQLAIQLNGSQWYVSTTTVSTTGQSAGAFANSVNSTATVGGSQNIPSPAASTANFWSQSFTPTAANWNALTFTPGSSSVNSAVTVGSVAGSNLSGNITGVGLYWGTSTGTDRFDTFTVTGTLAVPEPSTVAYLLVSLMVLFGIARMKATRQVQLKHLV